MWFTRFTFVVVGLFALGSSVQGEPVASPAESASDQAAAMQSGIVRVGDAEIQYISQGAGQPIVLLPGGGLEVGYMQGLSNALTRVGYRVVRVNFRGAGRSTGPSEGLTLHALAADVAGVIEQLKLAPANVAGHAFGNRVARTLAGDRPDLVNSVILFAAGGKVAGSAQAEEALNVIFTPDSTQAAVMQAMRFMVGDPGNSERVWQAIKPYRAPRAAGIEAQATKETPLQDWWAPAGNARYLILQGSNDLAAPAENGALLKQDLGDRVTLVTIPQTGHMLVVEQPDKIAAAVTSFLRIQ